MPQTEPKLIVKVINPGGDLYVGDTMPELEIGEDGKISCISHSKEELLSRSWTIR